MPLFSKEKRFKKVSEEMSNKEEKVKELKARIEPLVKKLDELQTVEDNVSDFSKDVAERIIKSKMERLFPLFDKYFDELKEYLIVYLKYIKYYIKEQKKARVKAGEESEMEVTDEMKKTMELSAITGIKNYIDSVLKKIKINMRIAEKVLGKEKMEEYYGQLDKGIKKFNKIKKDFDKKQLEVKADLIELGYDKKSVEALI